MDQDKRAVKFTDATKQDAEGGYRGFRALLRRRGRKPKATIVVKIGPKSTNKRKKKSAKIIGVLKEEGKEKDAVSGEKRAVRLI